ncbi:MAG TPA: polymer-forming cytoskeletal protein [Anaerolineales bacterium]|nr:polymer-forming cytoskeletal protein [Anaerolineales bacterium]
MNIKFRTITFILLLALLLLPTGPVYAQGPGPGDGRVVFGSNVTIESGDPFEGDLVVFGGNVTIEEDAVMNGDLVVIGGRVESAGEVNGDVVNVGGQLVLNETAVVSGNVVTVGGQLSRDDGAQVEGDVVNNVFPQIDIPNGNIPPVVPDVPGVPEVPNVPNVPGIPDVPSIVNVRFNPFLQFGRVFTSSLLMAILGVLTVLFLKERLDKVSQAAVQQPLMTTGIGLLTIVAIGVVAVTIILLPFAALSLIPLGFAWLFGVIAIGQEIGERFAKALRQEWAPVLATGLGTFMLMFIVGFIQSLNEFSWVVGCFTWIVPVFVGLLAIGAVVITRFGGRQVPGPGVSVYTPPADANQVPPASDA